MTARVLLQPILLAGSKLRDAAIKVTGEAVNVKTPATKSRDIFGTTTSGGYNSPFRTQVIPLWEDYRMSLTIGYMSEEGLPYLMMQAKMADDIPEGSLIILETLEPSTGELQDSIFQVVKNEVRVSGTQYARQLRTVPYRGDTF